jgi:hypothetical protein
VICLEPGGLPQRAPADIQLLAESVRPLAIPSPLLRWFDIASSGFDITSQLLAWVLCMAAC